MNPQLPHSSGQKCHRDLLQHILPGSRPAWAGGKWEVKHWLWISDCFKLIALKGVTGKSCCWSFEALEHRHIHCQELSFLAHNHISLADNKLKKNDPMEERSVFNLSVKLVFIQLKPSAITSGVNNGILAESNTAVWYTGFAHWIMCYTTTVVLELESFEFILVEA